MNIIPTYPESPDEAFRSALSALLGVDVPETICYPPCPTQAEELMSLISDHHDDSRVQWSTNTAIVEAARLLVRKAIESENI